MKTLKILCFLLAAGSLLITSCKKENPVDPGQPDEPGKPPVQKKCYTTKVMQDNSLWEEYAYTGDNRIDIMTLNDTVTGSASAYKLEYDANGNLMKAVNTQPMGSDSLYYLFTYNADNTVQKSEWIIVSAGEKGVVQSYTFEYNSQRQIIKASIANIFAGPDPYLLLELEYDGSGNNSRTKSFYIEDGEMEHIGTEEYTFDDKRNPMHGVQVPIIDNMRFPAGPNNIINKVELGGGPSYNSLFTYTYTADGYPETVKIKESNSPERTQTFSYDCK